MNTVLRCYVCGEDVSKQFCLATMSDETDRVFVLHEKCSEQLESGTFVIYVNEKKTAKIS